MKRPTLLLAALTAWYALATLPCLGDFPAPTDWGEMEIAATAHKLATQGVYGNDLFTGFHGSESRYYVFMPLQPVLMAGSFKLLGLGVVQGRLVSVASGWLTLLLTYHLGRVLQGPAVGLAAAAALCFLQLAVEPLGTGIPLLDLARSMRFDILAPVWVLASCLGLVRAEATGSRLGFFATGTLVGLATLSHVWGAFVLPVLVGLLLWRTGWLARRTGGAVLVVAGFLVMLSPWVAFILEDTASFLGQMCRHHGRFDVLEPRWYLTNLLHEHWRYARWVGGAFRHPLLWPRVGLWVVAGATVWANVTLLSRLRRDRALADGLLFAALPALALAMALLVNQKRYPYTLLVLPFLALQVGLGLASAWRWAERVKPLRWLVGAVLLLAVGEGATGVAHGLVLARAATPYAEVTAAAARAIPEGVRVLIPQPYWMGLRSSATRSLVLLHLLADPRCHPGGGTLSMEEAWQRVGADYVIQEDRFVAYTNPANPAVEGLWRDFARVVRSRCPAAVGRVAVPGYEAATIHRCDR